MNTTQLITIGDNQTVILPKQFQLQGTEVYIKKIGNAVVLISKENPWQTFILKLSEYGVPLIDLSEEELLSDLENA
jgi:antitoxin VapB